MNGFSSILEAMGLHSSRFNISMVYFEDEVQMLEDWKLMWKLSQIREDMCVCFPLDCVIFLLFLEYSHLVSGNLTFCYAPSFIALEPMSLLVVSYGVFICILF